MNMPILFWVLWIINLLLLALACIGKGFRSSFGAGIDLNVLFIIGLFIILFGSLMIRIAFKQKPLSLVVISIPLLVVLVMYLFDKMTGEKI